MDGELSTKLKKRGDDTPAPNLIRFLSALRVPGVQLLDQGEGFKRLTYVDCPLLIAPAAWWLPTLP